MDHRLLLIWELKIIFAINRFGQGFMNNFSLFCDGMKIFYGSVSLLIFTLHNIEYWSVRISYIFCFTVINNHNVVISEHLYLILRKLI